MRTAGNRQPLPPSVSARRGPIRRVCVLVCTRERPNRLQKCLSSLANQTGLEDEGVVCNVCVADNNNTAKETQIRAAAKSVGLEIFYAHESVPGYSSVRNTALSMAVRQDADLIIFLDDDSTAAPDLVAQHVKAFECYDSDVISGAIEGIHFRVREGERLKKSGTGNVALRRWIFDETNGIGLRFDPRLNLLGYEDFEFFRELTRAGGVIIRSGRPVAHDIPSVLTDVCEPATRLEIDTARENFSIMMGRNEIVATRIRHGTLAVLSRLASRYTPILMRGVGFHINGLMTLPFNAARAARKHRAARDHVARAFAAVQGLWCPGYNRPLAKTGKLVPLPKHT